MRESFWQYRLDCFAPKGLNLGRLIHRFHNFLHFGCCIVLILALSFSLGTHAFFRVFCSANPLSDLSIVSFAVTCDLFQLRRDRHSHRL